MSSCQACCCCCCTSHPRRLSRVCSIALTGAARRRHAWCHATVVDVCGVATGLKRVYIKSWSSTVKCVHSATCTCAWQCMRCRSLDAKVLLRGMIAQCHGRCFHATACRTACCAFLVACTTLGPSKQGRACLRSSRPNFNIY